MPLVGQKTCILPQTRLYCGGLWVVVGRFGALDNTGVLFINKEDRTDVPRAVSPQFRR